MFFSIESIKIELIENQFGLHLKMQDHQCPLPGQTIDETVNIISKNFEILKSQYSKTAKGKLKEEEINEVCLKIVLHFFGMYNSWKYSNEKEKDRDLTFLEKDFKHPQTIDIVLWYFKLKYPSDYASKSSFLLDLSPADLLVYEKNRDDFYNFFR
ncbi:MAG: hypothetical protein JNN05_01035 [Candidatus Omnitrophica bacterium]|nr:hypothetical protein [Candidatus Omnitrophota bacterium]